MFGQPALFILTSCTGFCRQPVFLQTSGSLSIKVNAMNPIARWKQLSKLKKIFFVFLGLVSAYTIIGFVVVPAALKYGVIRTLEKSLGRKTTIQEIAFNPYALNLRVEGLSILDHDGKAFFSLDQLSADIRGWQSLIKMAGVVSEVDLEHPQIRIVMNQDGSFNFSDLIPTDGSAQTTTKGEADKEGQTTKPPRVLLEMLSVQGGNFIFEDRQKNVTHRIVDFFLAVRDVSGLPDDLAKPARVSLETSINGAPLVVNAESLIFDPSLKSSATIIFNEINARPYMAYIPVIEGRSLISARTQVFLALAYSMGASGAHNLAIHNLDVKDTRLAWKDPFNDPAQPNIRSPYKVQLDNFSLGLEIQVTDPAAMDITVKNIDLSLDNLRLLAQDGALKLASIDHFDIKDTSVDMAALKASVGSVNTHGGWFAAALEPQKRIDITRLMELPAREMSGSQTAPDEPIVLEQKTAMDAPQPQVQAGKTGQNPATVPEEEVAPDVVQTTESASPATALATENQGPAWTAELTAFTLEDYNLTFRDLSIAEPVSLTVTGLSFQARDFSTAPGNKIDVAFAMKINKRGVVSGTGQVCLDPIGSELEVHCQNTGLVFLSPYLQEYLNALLKGAKFTLNGKTTFAMEGDTPLASFQGNALVSGFDFQTRKESNLADWEVLTIKGISVQNEPLSASIDEIRLKGLTSWFILEKDGSINYANLIKKPPEAAQKQTPEPAPEEAQTQKAATPLELPDILIKSIVLEDGKIFFQDKSINPHFTTELDSLNGTITSVSSSPDAKATIEMAGKLDNHAPLNITGWAKPLTMPPAGKVVFGFKNIEMAPLSPYTAKYIGYRLSKGKLTLAHEYLYQGGLIDGDNLIVIDQLTLGEKVDSPDAIKAPIELALALLKDPKGRIELPVPVTGDPKDPQFKLGKVISKALANVILKVITSPFAALGALVGGGDELAYVNFESGSAHISPEGREKLAKLGKALQERPLLKMDIQGLTDPNLDREAITKARYAALLATVKKEAMGKAGQAVPLDQITIPDAEREDIIWDAYKKAEFDKEKNALGMVKKIEVPDMEAMLIKSITPVDDDLVQLAWQRSQAAKTLLLEETQIDPARVFIVEPPALADLDDKTKICRAEFSLK